MSEKPFVTLTDWQEHLRSDWRIAHGIWPHVRNYVPGWGYSKAEIDAFFEGESGGKKQVDWARITSKPSTYPPDAHTLVGAKHTASGLTIGHYLRATGATSFAFQQIPAGDLPSHATSHQYGGGDAIKLDDLATPDDNTDLDATISRHGLLPKLYGGTVRYLRADGTWATIVGADPLPHADTHESGGSDEVDHDSLVGFVPAEHLSLPNAFSSVINSGHDLALHTSLGLAPKTWKLDDFGTPDDNTDLDATTGHHGLLPKLYGGTVRFLRADGVWATLPDCDPNPHASDHELGGSDEVDHDALFGFVAAEHKSLPNTIAQVLSDHNVAAHNSLGITELGTGALAKDHGTPATDMLVNVCYGTGAAPPVGDVTEGALFIKYTA
jgi:hypothetical protein